MQCFHVIGTSILITSVSFVSQEDTGESTVPFHRGTAVFFSQCFHTVSYADITAVSKWF